MVHVSLREFLVTGRFGPIELGTHEDQVASLFGEPDLKGGTSRKHRRPSIWKYGSFEFHFDLKLRLVTLIHADHFETLVGGGELAIDPWVLSGQLQRRAAEQSLDEAQISYQLRAYPHDEECDEIRTGGEVRLLFCGEEGVAPEQRRLAAFWCGGAIP